MASRRFEQFSYSLIKKKTEIEGVVTLSALGAVVTQDIPGASIAKTGVGEYTVTLEDKYSACLGVYAQLAETAEDLQAVPGAVDVVSAKTMEILTVDATGAAADVTATATLYITLVLSNSSVN